MNVTLQINGKPVTLENVARGAQELSFTFADTAYLFRCHRLPDGSFLLERELTPGVWQRLTGSVWQAGRGPKRVQLGGREASIAEQTATSQTSQQTALSPPAPMPGLIRQILVAAGDRVKQGQPLVVMEAMKLQLTLSAGAEATVDNVLVREGEMVAEGAELVRLTAMPPKEPA